MKLLSILALALLTACGADGQPTAPAAPGISLSGDARVGVTTGETP